MHIYEAAVIAFAMFSAIPMPNIFWTEKNMRMSLCFFPMVGLLIGLLLWIWTLMCNRFAMPEILRGAGLCMIPVILTGGIHLDGYADTWDALASHGGVDHCQRILKDPHIGTFAVIHLCGYFIILFAVMTSLSVESPFLFPCIFSLSRALSALALTCFPMREGSGTARSFADAADKKKVFCFSLIVSLAFCAGLIAAKAWSGIPAAAITFFAYLMIAEKRFGGVSGDLAGWFVQNAELWMLTAVCFQQWMENGT